MTFAETADAPRTEEVFGAYSPWPRRHKPSRRGAAALVSSVAAAAAFVHWGLPLLS